MTYGGVDIPIERTFGTSWDGDLYEVVFHKAEAYADTQEVGSFMSRFYVFGPICMVRE
jgi:hypothetical protein